MRVPRRDGCAGSPRRGVDGSLYFVGGAGINVQRLDGVTLAPIRLGVGLRGGASVGYLHYRREKSLNPL